MRAILLVLSASFCVRADEPGASQSTPPQATASAAQGLDISKAKAIAGNEDVIEKNLADYTVSPRKGIISPRTREYPLAAYADSTVQKIARVGDANFPKDDSGHSLYGSVQVIFEIRPDGSLQSAELSRSTADARLNEAALRIVRKAAPFEPFSPDIRKEYDILVLVRTLNFTREDIGVSSQ
ncbi:TonB family protein [Uliginosibacterium sp. 31-16]|uniref:TonB family protein n=1 Tax=Uliginosibacterium sp. 31-16 TaxID=3068315 RepID=UPI00273F13CC|nr:TonB family protein [Uliginosibacterium sp. 31-16]MDP5239265.1 TonB family protein [Uliginosibacterium sp. 31-16]